MTYPIDGTGWIQGIPFVRSTSPIKKEVNPARGLLDDFKPVLNIDLSKVDLFQHTRVDGRDWFALLGLTHTASSSEIDIAYNRLKKEWDASATARRYPDLQLREVKALEATYQEMEKLLKKAYTLLSYESHRVAYSRHLEHRDILLQSELDDWMLELRGVRPVPSRYAWGMLRGCFMRCLDTVIIKDGAAIDWWFTDKHGVIRSKKKPFKEHDLLQTLSHAPGGPVDSKGPPPGAECAVVSCETQAGRGPLGEQEAQLATLEMVQQVLEGKVKNAVVVQNYPGANVMYRATLSLHDWESSQLIVEMAEMSGASNTGFTEISSLGMRYERICTNLSSLSRYTASHIEQAHAVRVLKMELEFVTDIAGQLHLGNIATLIVHNLSAWACPLPQSPPKLKKDFEYTLSWFPDSPGGTLTEEQLRKTWPALETSLSLRASPRAHSTPPIIKSQFEVDPVWQNQYARTVRIRPRKAMVKNFTEKRLAPKSCRKGGHTLQESISLNAQIIRHPYMPNNTSCSVPGRHLKPTAVSMVKPWEYTARSSSSVLWTRPPPAPHREPDDPYGLELRGLAKDTGFPLEQLYEIYQRMGLSADSFQGFRDRDLTRSNPCNFIECEWEAFLKRCGVRKSMIAKRTFNVFMHEVGFGRKKRQFLPFRSAVFCLCAFGIGKRKAQAEALFTIMDESKDGSVSRAELLAFMTAMLPDGLELPKIETFKKVSELFRLLDGDGGGELEKDEFVDGISSEQEVYDKIQEMSPFKRYFQEWDPRDSSLRNIIEALDNKPPESDPVLKILEMLTLRCRAVYDHFKVNAADPDILTPDLRQPYVKKEVAKELLIEMGVREEWVEAEVGNMQDRVDGHLDGEDYVKILIGTAEMNPKGFEKLEERVKREQLVHEKKGRKKN